MDSPRSTNAYVSKTGALAPTRLGFFFALDLYNVMTCRILGSLGSSSNVL